MNINELNAKIINCKKCRLHKTRKNSLPGEGNLDAKIMLIAQAPGETENREGCMFVGPSGKILNNLFKEVRICREELYLTNLIKCMLPNCRKPKQDEIKICSYYLEEEIKIVNPEFLAPLGFYATNFIFDKYLFPCVSKKDFPDFIGKLLLVSERKIFPLTHPSAIIYDKSLLGPAKEKYNKLKIFSHQCKWFSVCPLKKFYEQGKLDRNWIELYCKGDWESCIRFQMEENFECHPDNMLPDGKIDKRL